MQNFLIGQFGMFNYEKQKRDFRKSFYGVEVCSMKDEKEVEKLVEDAEKNCYKICVHFPLREGQWRLRDAQYLSKDEDIRAQSYKYIEDEVKYISKFNVQYVLFHYPKPVILDKRADWTKWRFSDETEYCYEEEYSYEEFIEESEQFFNWISEKGKQYNFIPVLEFDALNEYVYKYTGLINLLEKYKNIKLCLDVARMHLQYNLDENFNPYEVIRKYGKYAEVIHLSNVRVQENLEKNHYPALKRLNPKEGWADVETYLKCIKEENKNCKILFEHRSEWISCEELEECYKWINEIYN